MHKREPEQESETQQSPRAEAVVVGDVDRSAEADLSSRRLLSFYDRLRKRVLHQVESRGGKIGPATVRALLVVPDVFLLLVRLTMDREVPHSTRALVGGALAYFILPFDLLPEAFLGPMGYLDDLILAVAVLEDAFSRELEPLARKHWSGSEDLRKVLRDLSASGRWLVGDSLYERVRRLLAKRGIPLS